MSCNAILVSASEGMNMTNYRIRMMKNLES